jgi:hypothetical protein
MCKRTPSEPVGAAACRRFQNCRGRRRRRPWGSSRCGSRGRQSHDVAVGDGAGRRLHRRLRSAAVRADRGHRRAPDDGAVDAGHVLALIHVRACPPARPRVGTAIERAWAAGGGPDDERLVVDVDSFVGETFGRAKQGAAFGYTKVRSYHPILAVRADAGEVLHIRLRTGSANTSRGIGRFCEELIARIDRAGGRGEKLLRADSGFWNNTVFDRLDRAGWQSRSVSACNPTSERRSRRSTSRRGSRWRTTPRPRSPRSPRPPSTTAGSAGWSTTPAGPRRSPNAETKEKTPPSAGLATSPG